MVGRRDARGLARSVVGDFEMASMRRGQIGDFFDARGRPVMDGEFEADSEPTKIEWRGDAGPGGLCAAGCTRRLQHGRSRLRPPACGKTAEASRAAYSSQ